ncbi:MAG: ROK family protein [Spirochaetota bacterium]
MDSILCGVDLGGTKLGVGLVSESGQVIEETLVYDHVSKTPDAIMDEIAGLIRALLRKHGVDESRLRGIGVGTAGHLRHRDGTLITMSNLPGFKGYPIRDRLKERFAAPVEVDNDANAQAYGEFRHGAGRGYRHMIFMTLSTQIGAGIVLDGKLFRGMTGTAGEIGHTIVDPGSDEVCPCGNRGCLISVASGIALPSAFRKKLQAGLSSSLASLSELDSVAIDGNLIARGLAIGDPACLAVLEDFTRFIGLGIYNLFQIFNPEVVVLGGGLTNWGDPFFAGIRRHFLELARDMMFEEMAILPGTCRSSGIVGAASLVLAS